MSKKNSKKEGRLIPTGECWCGCGKDASLGSFFVSGHDKFATGVVIKECYGSVAQFIEQHGFGPGGRNAREVATNV